MTGNVERVIVRDERQFRCLEKEFPEKKFRRIRNAQDVRGVSKDSEIIVRNLDSAGNRAEWELISYLRLAGFSIRYQ